MKAATLYVNLPEELDRELKRATDKTKDAYAPTKTQLAIRGLELALKELEKRK